MTIQSRLELYVVDEHRAIDVTKITHLEQRGDTVRINFVSGQHIEVLNSQMATLVNDIQRAMARVGAAR